MFSQSTPNVQKLNTSLPFKARLKALRTQAKLPQGKFAKAMNLSRGLLNGLETGREEPSDWVVQQVDMMERLGVHVILEPFKADANTVSQDLEPQQPRPLPAGLPGKRVPIVSWAHAGAAANYEEIPKDWQRATYTECTDQDAFGIEIEGDSMEKDYHEGDVAIVMPSVEPTNHSLVIAKLKKDGVAFKMLSFVGSGGKVIRLSSLNPVYGPADYHRRDFDWIYPVHSVTRMVWRKR
jgi:SOS-response transcriptional repressor LexA